MNTGILIIWATILVALIINYINLFEFRDYSNGTKEGEKVKHYLIVYWGSWFISLIPIVGLFVNLLWAAFQSEKYTCVCPLFKKV